MTSSHIIPFISSTSPGADDRLLRQIFGDHGYQLDSSQRFVPVALEDAPDIETFPGSAYLSFGPSAAPHDDSRFIELEPSTELPLGRNENTTPVGVHLESVDIHAGVGSHFGEESIVNNMYKREGGIERRYFQSHIRFKF